MQLAMGIILIVWFCFILLLSEYKMARYVNYSKTTYPCQNCHKVYNYYSSLARHLKHECGVEPRFHCSLCPYKTKHRSSLNTHLNGRHMKSLNDFYITSSHNGGNLIDRSDIKFDN